MNRLFSRLIVSLILACLLSIPALPITAQPAPVASPPISAQRSAEPALAADEETVSFARLGVAEQSLRGPFDATQLDFSLPAIWELTDNAAIQLNMTTFFAGQSGSTATGADAAQRSFGGTLQVLFNDELLDTILLDQLGERTVRVPISPSALRATTPDGRYRLRLLLDTAEQCGLEQYTNVVIRSSSALVLSHRVVAPPTDLAQLPRPLVQRSFLPDAATIIVPDQASAAELQAALSIAAGLGRMTESTFQLTLAPASRLDDAALRETHLIVVGKAAALPLRDRLQLAPAATGAADDGVVQLVVSPWNAANVVLVATGGSDAAVIKAAQAISTGVIRGTEQPDLALIAGIQPQAAADATSLDRSFAELGYDVQQMTGQGAQYAAFQFELPASQVITEEAYLDLAFVHTALLDYDQSGMTISLNGEPVASIRLDDTSTRLSSTRITLPNSALRAGNNTLVVRGDLLPRAICTDPRGNGLWLTIRPESLLHLPLGTPSDQTAAPALDLKRYPQPFTASANLRRVAFVVAAADPTAWDIAMQLAVELGRQTPGTVADLVVVNGDSLSEQTRQERDLVLVGRPSALPLLGELGAALPLSFAPGSDLASDTSSPVIYRQPANTSVGYVELLAAPWNAQRAVLAVLGSTDEGLRWAGAALTTPQQRSQLSGNLAIVHRDQIEASDTRPATAATSEHAEPPAAAAPTTSRLNRTILLAIGVIGVLTLALIVALALVWRRRRARRSSSAQAG